MKPNSCKAKGNKLEDLVVDKVINSGLDKKAFRVVGSGNGNRYKADVETKITIGNREIAFECKNHKTPHIKDWWEQTIELLKQNKLPILVYKLEREKYEDAKAVLYLNDLIEILKKAKKK